MSVFVRPYLPKFYAITDSYSIFYIFDIAHINSRDSCNYLSMFKNILELPLFSPVVHPLPSIFSLLPSHARTHACIRDTHTYAHTLTYVRDMLDRERVD